MSSLERKSIVLIAIAVGSATVRAMQFFESDVVCDNIEIISKYRSMVNDDIGRYAAIKGFASSGNQSGVNLVMMKSSCWRG
jgi:hypothetical protein